MKTEEFSAVTVYPAFFIETDRTQFGDKTGDRASVKITAGFWHDNTMGFRIALQPLRTARVEASPSTSIYMRHITFDRLMAALKEMVNEWVEWCDQLWAAVALHPIPLMEVWLQAGETPPISVTQE